MAPAQGLHAHIEKCKQLLFIILSWETVAAGMLLMDATSEEQDLEQAASLDHPN